MKKITSLLPIFAFVVLLASCNSSGEKKTDRIDTSDFQTVSASNLYQLSIPKYMKSATGLNVDASMQYQNIYKETYLAIIDEDKDDFTDVFKELGEYDDQLSVAGNYRRTQVEYFTDGIDIRNISEPVKLTIGGLSAEQVEFTARVPEVSYDIYYLMTFIEGRENIYMMMEWTLDENKETYKETFKKMAETFTEL